MKISDEREETEQPAQKNSGAFSQLSFGRREFMIGAAMLGTSGLAFARTPETVLPTIDNKTFNSWAPRQFSGWSMVADSGVVLPPPDAYRDRLYDNLVTRVYAQSNEPEIMLLLAYNNRQDGVLQVHRPEICYPVGGFDLSPIRKVTLPLDGKQIGAQIFTATDANRTEHVVYFTRIGSEFPRSWVEQRWAVVEANLVKLIPDGMMYRASLLGGSQNDALKLITRFSQEFVDGCAPKLRKALIGPSSGAQ